MHTLQWRPVGEGKVQDIQYHLDDGGRVVFTLPLGLEFGSLELDGLQVTGYFTPDDDETEWQLRPYLLTPLVDAG